MTALLPAITAIFLPIILGLISKNGNFIHAEHRQIIQQFAIRIAVPFMAFNSMRVINLQTAGQFLPMSFGLLFFMGIAWLFSWFLITRMTRKSKWFKKYQAELLIMSFGGNVGYICWKLHELLIGAEGLQRGIFYTSFYWPWLLSYAFLTVGVLKLSKQHSLDKKKILANIIPLLVMIAVGLVIGLNNIVLPVWLTQFTDSFGNMAVPLILFCMGLSISIKKSLASLWSLIPYLSVRLIIWVGATFILLQIPVFDEPSRKVLMINALAPLGVNPLVVTDMFGLDSEFVANSITVSTVLFLIFLPLLFLIWV